MTTPPLTQIAVLTQGFVYVGHCTIADGMITVTSAQNVRRWGTENGLGQLAQSGPHAKNQTRSRRHHPRAPASLGAFDRLQ